MIHPLIRLLVSKPHLLIDHLGGYVQLLGVQAQEAAQALRTRAILLVVMLVGVSLGIAFGGIALMLWAVVPMSDMAQPWLLWAVPGVPLLAAAICGLSLRRTPPAWSFELLREQATADAELLRELQQR